MQLSNKIDQKQSEFLSTIKSISSKVVGRYVSRGAIPERERGDVEDSIIEKFVLKKEQIDNRFKGKSKRSTYYTAVINRMCCEVIRKEHKHWHVVTNNSDEEFHHYATVELDSAKQTYVNEELKRFNNSIMLFNGTHSKVLLFLKYYFDIPLQESIITEYAGYNNKEAVLKILGNRKGLSKAAVTERLAKLVLLVENRDIGGDAVRMWINKQINVLLNRMNGNNKRFHNKETIGIMLEMKFYRFY
ncbi:hypothetical protein QA597_04495 [Marinilabiliaceae bacterium ANBcel2]|nr:hypothetical protein [Marinilabiliaceae bacterium ANBcel2]